MGKEDQFLANMARLDGSAKFLHKSFTVDTSSISNVLGKKLTVESLISSSSDAKKKEITKNYNKSIENKKKDNRISELDTNSIQAKKLKRKGAFEVNKEKVSDWDSTIQSRRLAKSYDFTNHKSEQPLQTIEESSKKFKIETPLEAEISNLLYGKSKNDQDNDNKNEFLKDHSKDLRATRKHLAEIAKARMMARQKEAKDKYQSKIKSKRYRRALRKRKQELSKEQDPTGNDKEMAEKADLARVEERATLRHKTVSKKLRFYDQTNTKESAVRRTQNLESQKLRAKVDLKNDSDSDNDKNVKTAKNIDSDDEDVLLKTSTMIAKKNSKETSNNVTTKRINPNDFIQTEIKELNDVESSDEEDEEEQNAFTADISTFDSGIDMDKKESEAKGPKVLPGWGSWSSELPKVKKPKQKKKPQKFKHSLVLKDSKKKLGEHQLMMVPHPYKSLEDCQSELSQPIGDTFMPKTTVMKSTKPKIHVKLGANLKPDQKDEI